MLRSVPTRVMKDACKYYTKSEYYSSVIKLLILQGSTIVNFYTACNNSSINFLVIKILTTYN